MTANRIESWRSARWLRFGLAILGAIQAQPVFLAQAQVAAVDTARIDRLTRNLADSGFSGVVLVATGDSVVFRRAYGHRGVPLKSNDAFWIASMTKGFTAATVLKLAERHQFFSLQDSIGSLLPGVPTDKHSITIRQLLTHTAGLGGSYTGAEITDRAQAVKAILAPPLIYPPGTGYQYGDADYELLAAIIETVTHKSWEDVVQRELLDPAALRQTGFWCRRAGSVPLPVAGADGSASRCRKDGGQSSDDWGHRGANGMSSTADDLLKWVRALESPGLLGDRNRIALGSPQIFVRKEGPDDISYGYGVRIYSTSGHVSEVMHSGAGDDGHTGIVRVLRSGITVIVLSNAGRKGDATWSSYVAQYLASR